MATFEPKHCRSCGRVIEWRKKWERSWDSVAYCSDACRARKVSATDTALEEWLLERLAAGARNAVIDPTAAVTALPMGRASPGIGAETRRGDGPAAGGAPPAGDPAELREAARRAARRLVNRGLAEMVQHGAVVHPSTAKGPVGLRRPR